MLSSMARGGAGQKGSLSIYIHKHREGVTPPLPRIDTPSAQTSPHSLYRQPYFRSSQAQRRITHTYTRNLTRTHTLSLSQTHTHTPPTHTHTTSHTRTHSLSHTHTHHPHTHTHTHTHTFCKQPCFRYTRRDAATHTHTQPHIHTTSHTRTHSLGVKGYPWLRVNPNPQLLIRNPTLFSFLPGATPHLEAWSHSLNNG